MFKVFIAEDESIVREGLRDSIPWNDCGFEFVGDAMDGETALPMILELKPDLLITDIKMPFMDGLELSEKVKEVLPSTKIIIISGYDKFDFARRAITIKVDEYLLKPIRKEEILDVLSRVRLRLEEDRQLQEYMALYENSAREYEQYPRRALFERLISGKAGTEETVERANTLGIQLAADCYNTVIFMIGPKDQSLSYSDVADIQDEVIEKLLKDKDLVLFRSSLLSYCIVIKSTVPAAASKISECTDIIRSVCSSPASPLSWYVSHGCPVQSLSELGTSYSKASEMIAYRHFEPDIHILCSDTVPTTAPENITPESVNADPMVLRSFIKTGFAEETEAFVTDFLNSIREADKSSLFRNYLVISVRINAVAVVQELGGTREDFIASLPPIPANPDNASMRDYIIRILNAAISVRDTLAQSTGSDIVRIAMDYIDSHYTEEDMSLNTVAKAINISSNYLSAAFSQKTGSPFIEYITNKRIRKARELLARTQLRSGEIAAEVGFHDPSYFSFVFRKTVGCTPKEFRSGGAGK